jgi:hypothetical protein
VQEREVLLLIEEGDDDAEIHGRCD